MSALPDSKRPKNVQELKEFVQRYSSLINKMPGQHAVSSGGALPSKTTSAADVSSSLPLFADSLSKNRMQGLVHHQPPARPSPPLASGSSQTVPLSSSSSQAANAHIAEHFKNSLLASAANRPSLPVLDSSQELSLPPSRAPVFIPQLPSSSGSDGSSTETPKQQQQQQFGAGTMHAPVTTQFGHTSNSLAPPAPLTQPATVASSSSPAVATSSGIQAGIATPLPPGLTLETLGVLCRLPETDLHKLKLPPALLSAIKVWKARQLPTKSKVSMRVYKCVWYTYTATVKPTVITLWESPTCD